MRPLCPVCNARPVAINCRNGDKVYYRKVCDNCSRSGKKPKLVPQWAKSGYKKKPQCEMCGFKLKFPSQSVVYHIDGNLNNVNWHNLKTVCLNCQQELYNSRLGWKPAKIVPDF